MVLKTCPRCKKEKSITEFQKNRKAKDGLQYHCKSCRSEIDCRPEKRQQDRERYHANRDAWKNQDTKRKYGISLEEYNKILMTQNGVCAICGEKCSSGRNLAIDHCHSTGVIRGLLCGNCNLSIGKFKDSISILQNAINYLRKV